MNLERLRPEAPPLSADAVASGLRLGDLAPPERPYVVLNMVATADGRATVDGRAGPIGNEADRQLFHHLRTQTDAVMAGARTVTVERYGRLVRNPALRDKRREERLAGDPLAVLVSGRLDLPADVPLLQDEHSRVVIITGSDARLEGCRAEVDYVRSTGPTADLATSLHALRTQHGVRSVLCEGGPTLNAALLREGLVDELFLSVAAKLGGGPDALPIVRGLPGGGVIDMDLIWALRAGSDVFLRYRLAGAGRT